MGQSGPLGQRQSILEARQRHHAQAAAGSGFRDACRWARRAVVHVGGQSRSVGRSENRRNARCGAISEEARRDAGAADLQVRFPGHAIHLPVEREV